MEGFVIAPFVLLFGMFGALVPLILLGLVIYFPVQVKRAIDDLSLEIRDTRAAIQNAAGRFDQPPSQNPNP